MKSKTQKQEIEELKMWSAINLVGIFTLLIVIVIGIFGFIGMSNRITQLEDAEKFEFDDIEIDGKRMLEVIGDLYAITKDAEWVCENRTVQKTVWVKNWCVEQIIPKLGHSATGDEDCYCSRDKGEYKCYCVGDYPEACTDEKMNLYCYGQEFIDCLTQGDEKGNLLVNETVPICTLQKEMK